MATATVTVMFTDLVDSTALMSRVGEVAAEGLRREHFALLRAAVDRRGGTEVKNLGDGLMVVFPSAADAVAAAVEIQQSFGRRNRREVEPLLVRVGLALGDADLDEGDYFGVPVVQASRLCARAAGGEVLCTDVVRLLGGSRVEASFESVGELELKGLAEPVATSRVTWPADEPDAVEAVATMPARLQASATDRFVGRADERERIDAAWKQATAESAARIVLLSGEPGIGKTTLTAEFAARVLASGAVVVYGRCDEDLGIPYQPWIESLGQLVSALPDEVLSAHVLDRGAHLGRLVPMLARRTGAEVPAGDAGETERYVLLTCVADLLERAAAAAPVLVVLDDLHWADRQSVQVLRHIATSAVQAPMLVLGTFRDTDVADGDPMSDLLAALHRVATAERIHLRGLGDDDLLELLERLAGHTLDDAGVALRDAVLAETDGNPFFVGEILRHLAETGAIRQDDRGHWAGDDILRDAGLPVSVTEVVGRRVASLGADAHQLLTLASVIGRDFDIATLAVASGLDELDVIDHCDAAVRTAVLQPTSVVDRYTFNHALVERTLYDSLSPSRRARAHRSIAEALEAIHGDDPARAGELAHHWIQAVRPTDTARARHHARRAGDRALEQLAPDTALHWYRQALELADPGVADRDHVELLVGLGTAQRLAGLAEHRETLLEAARIADSIGAADLHIRSTLANHRGWQSSIGNVDHERLAGIDRALELAGDTDTPERARLLVQAAIEQINGSPLSERQTLVERATAIARRLGDHELLLWTLAYGCVGARGPQTTDWRSQRFEEARELLLESTSAEAAATAWGESMYVAVDRGDIALAEHHHAAWVAEARRSANPSIQWSTSFTAAVAPMIRGDLDEAERRAEAALSFGLDSGEPDAFAIYGSQITVIRNFQGRLHELIPLMEDALVAGPELHGYRAGIALAHVSAGDHETATSLVDAEMAMSFPSTDDEGWSFTVATWAQVVWSVGHVEAAALLHPLLAPHRSQFIWGQTIVSAACSMHLGLLEHTLGRFDDADRSFEEADAFHRRLESPMLVALSQAYWATTLITRAHPGDRERAHRLATDAVDVAVRGGYGFVERIAREALAALEA